MGNSVRTFIAEVTVSNDGSGDRNVQQKRKRDDEEVETAESLQLLKTPKRKRVKSTSKYIYQTLFLDGENSDITLHAHGIRWKLHKLYLKQSPYFASMFGGAWVESEKESIDINIDDDNITVESLKIAFGSLYKDDVFIKPVQITSVIAAARLLQLDGLLQQCIIMMKDTLSAHTVVKYHTASCLYDLEDIKTLTLSWLTHNILVTKHITFIKDISIGLMSEILSSPNLIVMQVEIDLYTLLKKWMYLVQNPTWSGESAALLKEADVFFASKITDDKCYVETEEGMEYLPAFSAVRWHHVVNDITSIKTIENDKILPVGMLEPMFLYGWKRVLAVDQGHDKGPVEHMTEVVFNENCTRCGRILPKQADYCWRWVGYSFGVDILVCIINDGKLVSVKRNTYSQGCQQAVSLIDQRHIAYRLSVASLDEDGKERWYKTTGIKHVGLGRDEEDIAFVIDKDVDYPLALSMNVVYVTPSDKHAIPRLELPNG